MDEANLPKILIAPNSFKECSDSVSAAKLIYEYLSEKIKAEYIKSPVSDGGDGFIDVCEATFKGKRITYTISTAYDDSFINCDVLYVPENKEIIIESAEILGLKKIPLEKRNPILLSSKGLGELFQKIAEDLFDGKLDVGSVVVGIGGTGTIDMGAGAASVFGLKLFDAENVELPVIPKNFIGAKSVKWEQPHLPFKINCILDVNNPLLGENGGIRIYGKQKGASDEDIQIIEKGIENILNLLKEQTSVTIDTFLSGAGGGIPVGLKLFFGSKEIYGEEFILQSLKLKSKIAEADILITGEGSFDEQSLMGKGSGILINEALREKKKTFLICGKIDKRIKEELPEEVQIIELKNYFSSIEESITHFEEGIEIASGVIAAKLK